MYFVALVKPPGWLPPAPSSPLNRPSSELRVFLMVPFQFCVELPDHIPYEIFSSSRSKIWQTIASGKARPEPLVYVDPDASKFGFRFYRIAAAGVPSTNVFGYVSVSTAPGYSLIGNPFGSPSAPVADLFKGWPDGTTLSKFDPLNYHLVENTLKNGRWLNPTDRLSSGQGAVFLNPTSYYKSFSFVGDVFEGTNSVPIAAGFSLRCSVIPRPGALDEDHKFPIAERDVIHLFDSDRQKYIEYFYLDAKWAGASPMLGVGESFWIAKTRPANWVQTLEFPPLETRNELP